MQIQYRSVGSKKEIAFVYYSLVLSIKNVTTFSRFFDLSLSHVLNRPQCNDPPKKDITIFPNLASSYGSHID